MSILDTKEFKKIPKVFWLKHYGINGNVANPLEEVKKRQELIIKYFINKDVDIAKDEFVKQDKLDYQKRIMQVTEEADKLRIGLETNGKLKTVKTNDSAAGITELCTTLSKSLNTSALKPTQPIFDPKGSKDDYIKYREWRTRFVFFVKHLDHMDKHVWLKDSVRGEALNKIKTISEVDENN